MTPTAVNWNYGNNGTCESNNDAPTCPTPLCPLSCKKCCCLNFIIAKNLPYDALLCMVQTTTFQTLSGSKARESSTLILEMAENWSSAAPPTVNKEHLTPWHDYLNANHRRGRQCSISKCKEKNIKYELSFVTATKKAASGFHSWCCMHHLLPSHYLFIVGVCFSCFPNIRNWCISIITKTFLTLKLDISVAYLIKRKADKQHSWRTKKSQYDHIIKK